jgi:opacity protein-like surface antigen
MKKLVLAAFVTMLFSSAAFAATARQNTGCGLGTILWKNKADGSIVSQSLQATTNGTFGNQTFGITSGTLDCGTPPNVVYNERLKEFVVANMDNLAKDIAVGRGESLNTFDELLQIPADQRPEFNAKLQSSFGSIFTHDQIAYAEVMNNMAAVTAIQ